MTNLPPEFLTKAPKASHAARRARQAAALKAQALEAHLLQPEAPAGLWVPPAAQRELVEKRHQYEQQMVHMMQMKGTMDQFNVLLREVDPYLELVKAEERVEAGFPLKPGFWHVIRHNPGAPPSVMTIEGPNGEYEEPTSRVFELLQKNDMWNANSLKEENRKRRKLQEMEDRQRDNDRAARQAEMLERYKAATQTQVSMLPGWSQNVAGKRGRKSAES